jgi:DNA-binding MarR family transcriptional regulator
VPIDIERLGRAVKVAQSRNHRAADTRLRALGITLVQWDALRAIENLAGASGHDLAVATFQTDQSFGTLAGRLEAQGLIVRRPGRGRRIEHHLTAEGQRLLAEGREAVHVVLGELFGRLTEADRAHLLDLLGKIGTGDEPDPIRD